MKQLFLLIFISLFCFAVQANPEETNPKMYKWVDEDGNVQYTQTPPPEGIEAERVKLSFAPPKESENPAEEAADVETDTEEATAEEPDPAAEMQAQKKESCDNARNELQKLGSSEGGLVVPDKDDPEKFVALTEEERQQRLKKAQAFVDTFCTDESSAEEEQ